MDSNTSLLWLLTAALILSVAAVRRRLVFEIQASSLLVFGRPQVGIYLYSLIFLPGTILHELSHWIVAEILQVPTGKIEILPDLEKSDNGEERLGYVMTGRTGPLRGFLIGIAPLITGIISLILLGYAFETLRADSAPLWQLILVIYGLIVVGNSMIVSRADMRNLPIIAILTAILLSLAIYFGLTFPENIRDLIAAVLTRVNMALGLTIGLNLGMILISYAVRRGLERVTNKRIARGR